MPCTEYQRAFGAHSGIRRFHLQDGQVLYGSHTPGYLAGVPANPPAGARTFQKPPAPRRPLIWQVRSACAQSAHQFPVTLTNSVTLTV